MTNFVGTEEQNARTQYTTVGFKMQPQHNLHPNLIRIFCITIPLRNANERMQDFIQSKSAWSARHVCIPKRHPSTAALSNCQPLVNQTPCNHGNFAARWQLPTLSGIEPKKVETVAEYLYVESIWCP